MTTDLINIFLGFLEGFALIISPCILPILPIVLATSISGSRKKPFGIIIGFSFAFALIAYFSRIFVQYTGIDLNIIRHISYFILILLGLIMLSSYLSEKVERITQKIIKTDWKFKNTKEGFYNGIFIGGLIAIIWAPCAGPILAAVIVQTVIQKTTLISFFILLAFAIGAAIPMFIIAIFGRKIINAFPILKLNPILIRKILGIIVIASVGFMIYSEEKDINANIPESTIKMTNRLENGLWQPYRAPEIKGINEWINSPPLSIAALKGKVILIDFWTYSCINCIRTFPYLKDWYKKYKDKGFIIIGIHSPEFDFERNLINVKNAVQRYGITYPVALDNEFQTWRNFDNQYWPMHYLINKEGNVVYTHAGEGAYAVTENNIRFLLGIKDLSPMISNNESHFLSQTPETYFGYNRANILLSPSLKLNKIAKYSFPTDLNDNSWGLQGEWIVKENKIISTKANAAIKLNFNARKVFLVMGNNTKAPIQVKILLNGAPLTDQQQGKDVSNSSLSVEKYSLYEVLSLDKFTNAIIEVIATEPGVEFYTFTFGS